MIRQSSETTNYRWIILLTLFLVQVVVCVAWSSFGPLAPFLIDAFQITRAQVGLFTSLTTLAVAFLSVPGGWLVDRFGVRWPLLLGSGTFGLLFALLSQVPNAATGYAVVFAAGIGFVLVTPTTTMALVHWFPAKSRGTVVSIKQSGTAIGSAVGAILIPSLSLLFGWRNAVAVIGIGVVVFVALGTAIYRDRATTKPNLQAPTLRMFRQVLADRALMHLGLVSAAYLALQMSIMSYLVLQLVEVRGMSEVVAGTFLMATNLGGVAGRIVLGLFSDRLFNGQRWQVMTLIGVVSGAMAIFLSAASDTASWALLYAAVIVLGFASLGWTGVFLTFASELSGKEHVATGLGWSLTLNNLGAVVGPPLFGYIVDATSSYSPAWLLFGILAIITGLSMVWLPGRKRHNDHDY